MVLVAPNLFFEGHLLMLAILILV